MTDDRNISTEHQKDGDAKHPSDTLNRDQGGGELTPKAPSPSQGTDTGIGQTDDARAPKPGDFDPEKDAGRNHSEGRQMDSKTAAQANESDTPDYS
ncbi:hypothetical protein GGR88_002256 [Sphingomonas jejuensis]|uniref:Uncharacterized protein n=1 Tax=Sphingomonas jejuensis TaxID=904715 RepID=A0ABX0XPU6_9SPHN|nr:hypothetical protein [Sphingomonas jejuensis]NJC34742.1 hypothetical protein [Sphingomonas jejuensis]